MIWNNANTPPDTSREVLVTDGAGSFAAAWWHNGHCCWLVSYDMLAAYNYDGGCSIEINGPITEWTEINHP